MKKIIIIILFCVLKICVLKTHAQQIINKNSLKVYQSTDSSFSNKTIIQKVSKESAYQKIPEPTFQDGSNNPEDYGFKIIYINGKMFYFKEDNNITILFEAKN